MTYVIAGLHGDLGNYTSLSKKVGFTDDDVIYILGDLTHGSDPAGLICELSMKMNVYPIMSGADYTALRMLHRFEKVLSSGKAPDAEYIEQMKNWVAHGGNAMLEGFRGLDADMKEGVLDYLGEFTLFEETTVGGKNYFMLNAGISDFDASEDPEELEPSRFTKDKLDMNKTYYKGKIMITAKAEQGEYDKITSRGNNISLGCGKCACLCLENGEQYYV